MNTSVATNGTILCLQQEDTNVMDDEDKENDSSAANRGSTQASGDATQASKKPLTMNFDEYKRLSNTLVLYIRQREEEEELRSGRQGLKLDFFSFH